MPGSELDREFPWLGNHGAHSIQIVDTSSMTETVHDSAHTIALASEQLLVPESAVSRDITSFLWLPPPLQEVWSRLDPGRRAVVAIGSWDALVEQYLSSGTDTDPTPDRSQIERLLLRRMSRTPAHLVFVLEREDQTALDYLVNGVLVAHRESEDDRLQRWLTVLKLRGVRIANPSYPYTLEEAKFECIMPARPYAVRRWGRPDPEPDAMPGHLWPGANTYADSFGRMPYGKVTLLEMDDPTPVEVGEVLTFPMIAQAISRGGHVLMIPHPSETPDDVLEKLKGSVPRERLLDGLRVLLSLGWGLPGSADAQQIVMGAPRFEFATPGGEPTRAESFHFVREGATARTPGLVVVSADGLEAMAASAGTPLSQKSGADSPRACWPPFGASRSTRS